MSRGARRREQLNLELQRQQISRLTQSNADDNVIDNDHHCYDPPVISSRPHRSSVSLSSSTCCSFRHTKLMSSSTLRQIASTEDVCFHTAAQSSTRTDANRNPSRSAPFTDSGGHRKRGAGLGAPSTN